MNENTPVGSVNSPPAKSDVPEPSEALQVPAVVRWRRGVITGERATWRGAAEFHVTITDPDGGTRAARALAYPALVGLPQVGDTVLLNTGALDRSLGTGGYALVVAIPDRLPADPPPGPGHLVKARYTPLQPMVLGVDDQESPHHDTIAAATGLDGVPVVVADLHSALPAVIAGARSHRPNLRVVYVMTDGAALPGWFSRAAAGLVEAGWLAGTVTVGQAFGGDLEAATLHTGLLAARHVLDADLIVVAQGPGNLGTGTPWGFSGIAVGEALNAVAVLGGRPIACLRVSGADPRERHLGISHHSVTALAKVALAPAEVVLPVLDDVAGLPDGLAERVRAQASELGGRHTVVTEQPDGLSDALRASPVRLSTMGRGLDDDPASFVAAAAAGRYAARCVR